MSEFSRLLDSIRNIALVVLLLVIGVSYHPTIVNMSKVAGYESGTILSRYIELLFMGILALSILSIGLSFFRSKMIRSMVVWMVIVGVAGLAALALFNSHKVLGDIKSLIIVFGAVIIGWSLKPSRTFLYILFFYFIGSILFSGLSQVFTRIGGFIIADQYLTDAKNSLGALLASATLLSLFMVHDTKIPLIRIICIACVVLGILLLLVIRARMAFLTTAIMILYYLYIYYRRKYLILLVVLLIPILVVLVFFLPTSIFDFIGASFTAGTQGEDFGSGRIETYTQALTLFWENPLLGNIKGEVQIDWVHNFPLLKLSSFGLLFSWPILTLYFIILWNAFIRSVRHTGMVSFMNLFLLVPFVISMAEPTFPFGPGTVTVFNFLLFGIADKAIVTNSTPN